MKLSAFALTIAIPCLAAFAEERPADRRATTSLAFVGPNGAQVVDLDVSIDSVPFDAYWDKAFDALFAFADADGNGVLSGDEIRLAPSARAVRLTLGNGFAAPVAPLQSLKDVLEDPAQTCTAEALARYYRRHRAGGVQVGFGRLPHAAALTEALVQALDRDENGVLARSELQSAESSLRRLDANDDELIGAGELLPTCVYPGCAATSETSETIVVEASSAPGSRSIASWPISLSDPIGETSLSLGAGAGARVRCEAWSVAGPLSGLYEQVRDRVAGAQAAPSPARSPDSDSRGAENDLSWLTPLVDRDRDGSASPEEIAAWLEIQKLLYRGQLLVSVYYGGGLFEMLDANHDAGLSPRELRNAWDVLVAAKCTSGENVDLGAAPSVVMMVASQGYPLSFARTTTAGVEWFRKMDRNRDGDVSRREFTGPIEAFSKLDSNRDGLISSDEARRIEKQ